MFLLFVNQNSMYANAFVDEIQRAGGLKVMVPNMLSEMAMQAIHRGEVKFIPLGIAPSEPPPPEPTKEE